MNSRMALKKCRDFARRAVRSEGRLRLVPRVFLPETAAGSFVATAPNAGRPDLGPGNERGPGASWNESFTCHARVVARYALLLAHTLGMTDEVFLRELERGAHLHDIGKIGIPRSILVKSGTLTALERDIMSDHPLIGWGMVRGLDVSREVRRAILCHHERFDGRGYPFGLSGGTIPGEARIIALADALDAITSDRSYRSRRGFGQARLEILRDRGTTFDPDVVDAFLSLPIEFWRRVKLQEVCLLSTPKTIQ